MSLGSELGRIVLIIFVTSFLVAFLWQAPGFLAAVLLVPLALSFWFWPEGSTVLSYFVAALVGSLFTAWSYVDAISRPAGILSLIWLPMVWGPAGVVIKRLELLYVNMRKKRKSRV